MSKLFANLHRNYRLSILFMLLIACFIIVTPVNVMAKYLDKPSIDGISISYEPENLLKRSYEISPLTTSTPVDLVATATSAKEVRLTWTDTARGEKEFKIERAYNRSFSEGITSFFVPADTSSYIDKTTDRLTVYYYRIKAIFEEGESDWSNISVVLTPDYIPASPGLLNASSPAGLEVDFSWADYSGNEDGFRIERSTSSSFEGTITGFITEKDVHICTDRLVPGGTYYYRVIAFNSAGDSQPSNVVQVSVDSQIVEDIILIGSQIAEVRLSGFAQIFVPFRVDRRGLVLDRDVNLNLIDQKGSIFIPRNTMMLSANNHAVTSLYYVRPELVPLPPEGKVILDSFEFGPAKSTFNPPINIILKYDPSFALRVPINNDFSIGVWNGSYWEMIQDAKIDKEAHTIQFKANHFSIFSIMASRAKVPAQFSVSDLVIFPRYANPGEQIILQVNAKNSGTIPGNYLLILKLNDRVQETRYVALDAQSSQTETFFLNGLAQGYYTINLNGLTSYLIVQSTSSPVLSPATPTGETNTIIPATTETLPVHIPARPPTIWITIIVVAMVLVILGSIYFLYVRRSH